MKKCLSSRNNSELVMKADLYTKSVLTVIAASLTAIAFQMTIPEAHAQRYSRNNGIQMVAVCNLNAEYGVTNCADVVGDRLQVSNR